MVAAAIGAAGTGCRHEAPSPIDPAVASAIPASATLLAGANLERVRASPLAGKLPPAVQTALEPWRDAAAVVIASDGHNFLALARGAFQQAPAGAALLSPGLAAAGSPDWVQAAARPHGAPAASPLLSRAQSAAGSGDLWIAAAGSAKLPLTGNGENLAQLLHSTDSTTLTLRLGDPITLEIVGNCRTPEAAQRLEETVRAYVSLAAGTSRQPALADLLRRVQVRRDSGTVRVTLTAQADELGTLFQLL